MTLFYTSHVTLLFFILLTLIRTGLLTLILFISGPSSGLVTVIGVICHRHHINMSSDVGDNQELFTPDQEAAVRKLLLVSSHYKILGLKSKSFTPAELTQARNRLARQFHPDKNKAPGSTEVTKAINRAYDVLSDPQKRKEYDDEQEETKRKEKEEKEDSHTRKRPQQKPRRPTSAHKSSSQKETEFSYCFLFCCFLPLMICFVPALIPAQTPVQHTDYERGLQHLWGREALDRLREHLENGDIEFFRLREMAKHMDVSRTFLEHRHIQNKVGVLEKMLKNWFENLHYRLQKKESKRKLISVLEKSKCSPDILSEMKHILEEKNFIERTWIFLREILVWGKRRPCELELEFLFGEFALERLRNYVESGEISDESLEKIARQMGVHQMFSLHYRNIRNGKMFQKILEEWFRQTLHRLQPGEAKKSLIFVLKVSDCSAPILEDIESALFQLPNLQWWKVRKYFNLFVEI